MIENSFQYPWKEIKKNDHLWHCALKTASYDSMMKNVRDYKKGGTQKHLKFVGTEIQLSLMSFEKVHINSHYSPWICIYAYANILLHFSILAF